MPCHAMPRLGTPCRALAGCRPPHHARRDRSASTARTLPSRSAEGFDVSESARPPMARRGLDQPPGRVRRLDARARTAAAAFRAPGRRVGGGRPGGDRRPPCLRSTYTPAAIFEHRGDNKLGQRNAKLLPSLHTLAGGLSCDPHTPAAPPWRLRTPGGRPRILSQGNCQLIGTRSAERRQMLDPWPDARSPAFGPFAPRTPPAQTPLPEHKEGGKGTPAAQNGPIRGVCRAKTRDSAGIFELIPGTSPARHAKHAHHQ